TPENGAEATPENAESTARTLNEEPAAQGEAAEAPAVDVAALQAENADLRDRLLRAAAEIENTRKRAERDKQDASRYATASFARDMLEVADNLRRALAALKEEEREAASESLKGMVEGVEVTERQLLTIFERHGIREISPKPGDRFDPNLHEAMFEVPGTEHPAGSVVHVIQAGCTIADRLLSAARVGVPTQAGAAQSGGKVDTPVYALSVIATSAGTKLPCPSDLDIHQHHACLFDILIPEREHFGEARGQSGGEVFRFAGIFCDIIELPFARALGSRYPDRFPVALANAAPAEKLPARHGICRMHAFCPALNPGQKRSARGRHDLAACGIRGGRRRACELEERRHPGQHRWKGMA